MTQVGEAERGTSDHEDSDVEVETVVETVIDEEAQGTILFEGRSLCVRLSSHPRAFQDVLAKHFRKVVELTNNFSRVDGYLPHEGCDITFKPLQTLTEMHEEEVKELEAEFHKEVCYKCKAVCQKQTSVTKPFS